MNAFDTSPPRDRPPRRRGLRLIARLRDGLPDLAAFVGALVVAGLAAVLVGLGGCGGGVGSEGTGSFAQGTISGYGSIIVNGIHFDESTAQVQDDDGATLTRSALALGMAVQIEAGDIVTGADGVQRATASRVRTSRALVGPVGAVDAAAGQLTVLGQTVQVNDDTVLDAGFAGGLAGIAAGRVVEVYGELDASAARFVATRIAPAGATATWRVRGAVSSVDAASGTCVIGSQTYRLASTSGVAAGSVLKLAVSGALPDAGGRWAVGGQQLGAALPSGRELQLAGVVDSVVSASRFVVDGVTVDLSGVTVNGTLAAGQRVEVRGSLSDGLLLATAVQSSSVQALRRFELNGQVAAIDLVARRLVVQAAGRELALSLARDDLVLQGGTLASLAVGTAVRVEVVLSADRTQLEAVAIRIGG